MALGVLDDVEWSGDFVTGVALVCLGLALVAYGFRWGRWRALGALAAVWVVPLIAADVLYYGFGVNAFGSYCGEPECDPGPLPATLLVGYLPVALALSGIGVRIRRAQSTGGRTLDEAGPV